MIIITIYLDFALDDHSYGLLIIICILMIGKLTGCARFYGKIETCRPCLRGSSRLACKRRSGWLFVIVVVGGGGGCATI